MRASALAERPHRSRRDTGVIYISGGNIPSQWAHTFQSMKQADGLAEWCDPVTVLVQRGVVRPFRPAVDLHEWYGISRRVRIQRLTTQILQPREVYRDRGSLRFERLAAEYVAWRGAGLVYTRSIAAAQRCARRGLPTVLEHHDTDERPGIIEGIRAASESPHLRAVVTITPYVRDRYAEGGVDPEKIIVWPDAVDPRPFLDLPSRAAARRELGLGGERPIALYAGHLYDFKGIPTVLDAAALLPEVRFILVGGWPEDVERTRERSRHLSNVACVGFVPHPRVPSHLAAADVLLLPNALNHPQARKTSPLKLFEYMAAGRPIVATAIPALEGVLRHGENACVVAPDSAAALAEGIRAMLDDTALAAGLASRARREVQRLTWKERAADILRAVGML